MSFHISTSRRSILRMSAYLGTAGAMSHVFPVAGQTLLRRTPDQIFGPFYPVGKDRSEQIADLTRIPGKTGRAEGQVLNVIGRVLTPNGAPVRGVKVEIWQANSRGRYTHPSDTNPAPIDPNFDGYGLVMTDDDGGYRFRTIRPGAYPVGPNTMRPPHIHFAVTGRDDLLVTQMY